MPKRILDENDIPHPAENTLLFLCIMTLAWLCYSLVSFVSFLRGIPYMMMATVIESNGVIGDLRFHAFCCLVPTALAGVTLKLTGPNRLASVLLTVSLICGSGYLLLEQLIRYVLDWH